MKQFYSRLMLLIILFGATYISTGQKYWGNLSGQAEVPANNSTGTGIALITIDAVANTMRVQVTFSGLLAGVTASHIHAATAAPGTGTAGVATSVPTFTGFPSGVTSGTYDHTFDMLQSSSYNPAYVTNNGGTPATAWAALLAAISAGRSYLNVHSSMFPGGEIRSFLSPCPAINVSIPDAFALSSGTLANTVYPAYPSASSITLASNVTGGKDPYNYSWSNGATTSSITVNPASTTNYTLTVTDLFGCPGSAMKTVNVVDVSGGTKGDKIVVCHHGNSLTIAGPAVADHLSHNDVLGSCEPGSFRVQSDNLQENDLDIRVLGNPSSKQFTIQLNGNSNNNIKLTVYDNLGRVIENRTSLSSNQTLSLGSSYRSGIYLIEISQGLQKQTLRLVKVN